MRGLSPRGEGALTYTTSGWEVHSSLTWQLWTRKERVETRPLL